MASAEGLNPVCGDAITLFLSEKDGRKQLHFDGKGCMLSLASASILMELAAQKPEEEWLSLSRMAESALETDAEDFPETILALRDVRRFPSRKKCALLAWKTFGRLLEENPTQTANNGA